MLVVDVHAGDSEEEGEGKTRCAHASDDGNKAANSNSERLVSARGKPDKHTSMRVRGEYLPG